MNKYCDKKLKLQSKQLNVRVNFHLKTPSNVIWMNVIIVVDNPLHGIYSENKLALTPLLVLY